MLLVTNVADWIPFRKRGKRPFFPFGVVSMKQYQCFAGRSEIRKTKAEVLVLKFARDVVLACCLKEHFLVRNILHLPSSGVPPFC